MSRRTADSAAASHRARIFRTGGSQAVRLPKECRLPGEEVLVRKVGSAVILTPLPSAYSDELREMLLGPEDAVIERPAQGRVDRRERLR